MPGATRSMYIPQELCAFALLCRAENNSRMNRRARRELRIQNDEGAEGGREITGSGACLPRW